MKCSNCGYENASEYKFCGMCGARLGRECPACGGTNPLDFVFCGHCGQRLPESVEDAAAESAPEEALTADGESSVLLSGERRVVTVLVADVTGSTELLEQLGNEAWVELMNRVLLALEAEIYRYGGVVNQFRGDGLVAFFGSDVSNEDDAERAALAGLAMQQAVQRFNAEVVNNDNGIIRLRVGINSGEVIVASIGDQRQHREDTAMGIAIAVAARLESAAEPGTVLTSESVYQQAQPQFAWEALGEISVKGFSQPLAVYRPTSVRQETDRAFHMAIFGSQMPLVGRENELHQLKKHIERLQAGQGSLILLSGETGIGKQALIAETRQYFVRQEALLADAEGRESRNEEAVHWLFGRCRSYNRNWPYSIWIELLNDWLGAYTGQHNDEIRAVLLERCRDLWGEQFDQYYPYLAELLHIELEAQYREKVQYLSADTLRLQISETLLSWLEGMAGCKPLAVVFSEVEWADPSSLAMVKTAAGLVERLPVAFILLYREDPQSTLEATLAAVTETLGDLVVEVELRPLAPEQCRQLIETLIGGEVFPQETSDLLVKNSEGNPSYIVEVLRSLIDNDVLVRTEDGQSWRLSRPVTPADLQSNLARLLQARIDRLGAEERQVLQMAAVIGMVFWSNVLQVMVGEQPTVREPLANLVKAQLIDRRGRNPELGWEFSFRTDLIHSVVYESLLTSQRENYHLKVAQTLEEISPEGSGIQHQALIAYHYRRAREPRKELFYAIWAAEKAREVYAVDESIEHYSRALELLDELEAGTSDEKQCRALYAQRFEVLTGRQAERFQRGDVEGGIADARALLELARKMQDEPSWMIDALLKQPEITFLETRENIDAGLKMADQALDLSRQLGDRHREMFSLIAKSRLMNIIGNLQSFPLASEALNLARELGDVETQVVLLVGISSAYGMEDVAHCVEYLQAALPLAEQVHNKRIQLELLAALGDQSEREGDYFKLLTEFMAKRLEISREIGDRLMEGAVLMYYAQVEGLYLGNYDAALVHTEKAFRLTENVAASLYPLLRLAQLQVCLGWFAEAEATLAQAIPLSERGAFAIGIAGRLLVSAFLGNSRAQPGDHEHALSEAEKVKHLVDEHKISAQYLMSACSESAQAFQGLARQTEDAGQRAEYSRRALEESGQARDIYERYGFVQVIECLSEEILYVHAVSLDINGMAEEAAQYLQRAYDEMMRKYGLIPSESQFRRTFLENIRLHRDIITAYPGRSS
jgi:predicted ATPase/class 3 adenylate cyclase